MGREKKGPPGFGHKTQSLALSQDRREASKATFPGSQALPDQSCCVVAGSDLSSGLWEKEGSRARGSNDTGERSLGNLDLWKGG